MKLKLKRIRKMNDINTQQYTDMTTKQKALILLEFLVKESKNKTSIAMHMAKSLIKENREIK